MNKKVKHLVSSQIKLLGRDSLMLFLVIYPLILTFVGRLIIPMISVSLKNAGIDLQMHYPAIMVFFVVMNTIVYGAVMGLMLLDERENNTVLAIRVLPIKFSHYIIAKSVLFTLLSVLSGMIVTESINLYDVPLIASFFINFVSSLGVLFGMLLINLFAKNKVEGFATLKASGILLILPVASFYFPYPFNFLAAFAPAFWPSYAIATFSEHFIMDVNVYMFLLIGFVYILFLSYAMYKILVKKLMMS